MKRGDYRQYTCGDFTITLFLDSKLVKFIDNCINRDIIVDMQRQVGSEKKTFKVPLVVKFYNEHKGTVDVSNQLQAVAPIDRKSRRKNCMRVATYMVESHLLINYPLLAYECDPTGRLAIQDPRDDLYNYWAGLRLEWMRNNGCAKVRRHGVKNWKSWPQISTVTHLKRWIDPGNHGKKRTCINCSTKSARCCDMCRIANDIVPFCQSCWSESNYH